MIGGVDCGYTYEFTIWKTSDAKGSLIIMKFTGTNRSLQNRFLSLLIAAFLYCTLGVVTANASGVDDINRADFWVGTLQKPNAVIMNGNQIKRYNKEMLSKLPNINYDFKKFPKTIVNKDLQKLLQANELPVGYVKGQKMSLDFRWRTLNNMNLAAVQTKNSVRWGIAVRRSSLRLYPTADGIFDEPNDTEFDSLQSTILNPGEAVVILHKSTDNQWLFVQSNTYRGWMLAADVAETSYKEWSKWQNPKVFLVVVAAKLNIQTDAENLLVEMGSHLPVLGKQDDRYIVKLPKRQEDGQVCFTEVAVPADENVNLGDLPYTRANIVKQAFKFYGQPYGWGGLNDSVDCSSFTMDIYRCFGFMMPRDADTQEVGVGKVWAVTPANVESLLNKALPGATLHMDGHVMLYLGRIGDSYYVINSLGSYGDNSNVGRDGLLARVPVMQVVTTDIKNTLRRNGKSFMDSLRTVKQWEY